MTIEQRGNLVAGVSAAIVFLFIVLGGLLAAEPRRVTVMSCQLTQNDSERAEWYYACGPGADGAMFKVVPGSPGDLRLRELVGRDVDVKLEVIR